MKSVQSTAYELSPSNFKHVTAWPVFKLVKTMTTKQIDLQFLHLLDIFEGQRYFKARCEILFMKSPSVQ